MESFQSYYDEESGNSRIDYYKGMDKTYQLSHNGQFGKSLKIVPMSDERVVNQMNCFAVDGSETDPIQIQSILPDLTDFKFKGPVNYNGQDVQKWQKKEEIGHKLNKYTMYISSDHQPVMYEMKGFNTLLGSHYDHYYLNYVNFKREKPDPRVFQDYNGTKCHGFPGM